MKSRGWVANVGRRASDRPSPYGPPQKPTQFRSLYFEYPYPRREEFAAHVRRNTFAIGGVLVSTQRRYPLFLNELCLD